MQRTKIAVTIICPIRNEQDYIGECLNSLVNQSYDSDKIEILVVDGMSDDNTREIVTNFQKKYKNIRLLDNPQKIVPVSMNIGIHAASGIYILRMDGHARADSEYVKKCIAALESQDVVGVGGPITSLNNTATGKAIALAMSSKFGVGNSRFRTSIEACWVDTVAFAAYKREVFDKYGLFDEEMVRCQDDEFNFRLRKSGGKILLTPEIKSWYYPRASFRKLWKQYFGYGYWKVRILQKHFWMMQLRHFVPVTFVSVLILSLTMSFLNPKSIWIFADILGFYLISAIGAAILIWNRNKAVPILKILLSFLILHFSYGTGFLWGLIKFAPYWIRKFSLVTFSHGATKQIRGEVIKN